MGAADATSSDVLVMRIVYIYGTKYVSMFFWINKEEGRQAGGQSG